MFRVFSIFLGLEFVYVGFEQNERKFVTVLKITSSWLVYFVCIAFDKFPDFCKFLCFFRP